MRQLSITILLISLVLLLNQNVAFSAIKGKIDYSIPVDYSKLSEPELSMKARKYYYSAIDSKEKTVTEDMTNALFLYSVLEKMNPDSVEYAVKLGVLNDRAGRDRYAKGYFSKALGIDKENPVIYYNFGEFYYRRESYRNALRHYNQAYKHGFDTNYDTLYKMGDIYEKFGDSRSALKYFKEAQKQSPNEELDNRILKIEAYDPANKEFYEDTRIRKPFYLNGWGE